jgi:GTP cyclohydrolase I
MVDTPWIDNGLSDEEKIARIESSMRDIMQTLGLDLEDDSLRDTPKRVAKMYVQELFSGLSKETFPKITVVENKFSYQQMLIETNIEINSVCEHHLVPIIGACHIAYIPKDKVLGLSKFNRIARYFAQRPQVQERLTQQIHRALKDVLGTDDVSVVIDAIHMCVRMRGVRDGHTITRTSAIDGVFKAGNARAEFFRSIPKTNEFRML